ncbi:MAG TPA: class I SAM-dependent methyltransferase [Thermoleophilaceae bacterium]
MASDPTTDSAELERLRERLEALEREDAERTARANAALAAAQDRSYWLDRWQLDLNALMRRPGASELRAGLRAARAIYRRAYDARSRLRDHKNSVPLRISAAKQAVDEERSLAESPSAGGGERYARSLSPSRLHAAPITELLYDRLGDDDVAAVEQRLAPSEAALWETADLHDRKRFTLAFAAHPELAGALERTGLRAAMPTAGVHAMAHGPQAAGGSYYYADLIADALRKSGAELRAGQSALDFGCSSGRVVRVLAAALPELDWHGCDPIPDAIDWARANLPGIAFENSPEYPPLPYADASFDAVFAISIWSHFAEGAALDWLAEMRRIVKPGGRLAFSTHGEQTVTHTHRAGLRSVEQLESVRAALFEQGFWYAAEFGEQGDHGVANPDWGTAFLSAEWLLTKLTPEWHVVLFRPGRVEDNQDLYVLERR